MSLNFQNMETLSKDSALSGISTVSSKSSGKVNCAEDSILTSLTKFFLDQHNLQQLLRVLHPTKKPEVSLRVIEWFVTNYSKKFNTSYVLNTEGISRTFIVYEEYKLQLSGYSKRQFDPCRRIKDKTKDPVSYYINQEDFIETSIGQLNFFRWAIRYRILDYVIKNKKTIIKDMQRSLKARVNPETGSMSETSSIDTNSFVSSTTTNSQRKRGQLSENAARTLRRHVGSITLKFD